MNRFAKTMFYGLLGLGSAVSAIPMAAAQGSTSSTRVSLSKHYVVQRGSKEYKAIERFIASKISGEHGAFGTEESLTTRSLGDVISVTLDYSATSTTDMTAMDVVPVPSPAPPWLPRDLHPTDGDTATVGTCSQSSGLSQTWSFVYVANPDGTGEWVVVSYQGTHVKSCSSPK